jgi:LytS/YehU family sensor histidine kinase
VVQSQLQTQVAEAELHALKQQLQPHFLFNALNAVAMLVREKQEERAVDTLAQLSALLRKLIDNTRQQQVTLASELDFTQRYLEIEKIRFGDRLTVRYDIPEELLRALVPSLVLQPLVENAIKHGISRRSEPGRIGITAKSMAGRLQMEVFNDVADDAAPESAPRVHLGLETTRERLRKTYGVDFELHCDFHQDNGSRVRVTLPLHFSEQTDAVAQNYSP